MASCPATLGAAHAAFQRWALGRGVRIAGVRAGVAPGQGMGIYATRALRAGETVLEVPLAAMLTIDSMPRDFVRRFADDAPVQAVMAAYLVVMARGEQQQQEQEQEQPADDGMQA
ncbi:hypothetical protein KEM52_003633, partial [Ascosphaera acerosa]